MGTTIFRGGTILTMGAGMQTDLLAVCDGRVIASGHADELIVRTDEPVEVIDLAGDVLVPGFIDAHHHLSLSVLYGNAIDCRPDVAATLTSVLDIIRSSCTRLDADAWVVAKGFDERRIRERRVPTSAELDEASGGRPVVLMHYTFHVCIVSVRAMELLGIGRNTPDPPGGSIARNRRGEPTGLLVETAMAAAESRAERELLLRDATFEARLARHESALFAAGVTRVADPTVSPQMEALYQSLRRQGRIRVQLVMLPVGRRGYLRIPEDRLDGRVTGEGPNAMRVGSLKLFADGADACAVAVRLGRAARGFATAVRGAVVDRNAASLRSLLRLRSRLEGLEVRSGIRFLTDPRANTVARNATERGFGLAIHAIGNEAFRDAVTLIEDVRSRHVDVPPPRIEHGFLVDLDWLRRAADSGIQLVVQPAFLAFAEGGPPTIPGMKVLPLRSAIEAGIHIAASSDFPVMDFRPLAGIDAAVHRRWDEDATVHEEEAVSGEQALAMYTREAARACGCLDVAGTLEPGKQADLVRLSADPRFIAGKNIEVRETWIAGERVHPPRTAA